MSAVPVAYREKTPSDGQERAWCRRIASQPLPLGGGLCSDPRIPRRGRREGAFEDRKPEAPDLPGESLSLHVATDHLPEKGRRQPGSEESRVSYSAERHRLQLLGST